MSAAMLLATHYGYNALDGMPMEHPATGQLAGIYELLRNGRNTKLTLHKDDGGRVEYELVPLAAQPEAGER